MKEKWKDIPNWEGYYQVSNLGRIKSVARSYKRYDKHEVQLKSKILRTFDMYDGTKVNLSRNGSHVNTSVAKVVAHAFVPGYRPKTTYSFKDSDVHNNNATNLEWVTFSESRERAKTLKRGPVTKPKTPARRVAQYNMSGRLIKVWNNAIEIEQECGISIANISRSCNLKRSHAADSQWRYIEHGQKPKKHLTV